MYNVIPATHPAYAAVAVERSVHGILDSPGNADMNLSINRSINHSMNQSLNR